MSPNRRIFLNIVATYGRSLYTLVVGLFCGRWTLMALGEVDYGLMGVVGGLIAFVQYFDSILASAIGRFFAIAVGEGKADRKSGIESGRKWFTTAVVIQTALPTFLLITFYPVGEWAVRHFLTIPPDRVQACVWVWRFVCLSGYLGMLTMPFRSMYMAHQYIAELTFYSFMTTTFNACFLYYMVTHPGVWLAKFAFWQCLLSMLPELIIAIRAYFLFPECRVVRRHIRCWCNIRAMAGFSLWTAIGTLGVILRGQGISILVNKIYGSRVNAGVAVGYSLSNHCNSLTDSMFNVFSPAIYNAWGEKNYDKARSMAYQICRVGTLFLLVFALPLSLEVDEVLRLWLKNPPQYAAGIFLFVMASTVIDKMAAGHMICVSASGKVAGYQSFLGTTLILTLPLAWLLVKLGMGVYSVGWALVATMAVCSSGRIWFARRLVGMSGRYWIRSVVVPLSGVVVLSLCVGSLPRFFLSASLARVCFTVGVVEFFMIPFSWFFVLSGSERAFVVSRVNAVVSKMRRTC